MEYALSMNLNLGGTGVFFISCNKKNDLDLPTPTTNSNTWTVDNPINNGKWIFFPLTAIQMADISTIRINYIDSKLNNFTEYFQLIKIGNTITINDINDTEYLSTFKIKAITIDSDYITFDVIHKSGSGILYVNNYFSFIFDTQENGHVKIINQIDQSISIPTRIYYIYDNPTGLDKKELFYNETVYDFRIIELPPNTYSLEYDINFETFNQDILVKKNDTTIVVLIF